jgi:hypothetical protein
MSKPDVKIALPEVQAIQKELLLEKQQKFLNEFLDNVRELVKEQAKHYLQSISGETRSIVIKPQVFISYAWEPEKSDALGYLQFFLKQLQADLERSGLKVWFDLEFMTGHVSQQMETNIKKSQYVLFIGTDRYAQRTTKLRNYDYELVLTSLAADQKIEDRIKELQDNKNYQKKPILIEQNNQLIVYGMTENGAWRSVAAGLFTHPFNELKHFPGHSADPVVLDKSKIPQSVYQEMEKYHYRNNMTNVYKELVFALAEEEKRREHYQDFLLPLMLEGDYVPTFPQLLQYIIRDGRSWYSFKNGGWTSYEDYIKGLTQAGSEGILPCLLGLNRRDDYPDFRESCAKKYKQAQELLMHRLEKLQSGTNIPKIPKKSTPVAKNRFTFLGNLDTKGIDEKTVVPLLALVVKGKQDEAEKMINQKAGLLQVSGFITDPAKRKFTKITPFKYAVWSRDWAMSEMILKYLPPEIAISQFNELDSKGTEYGSSFNINPLTNALQTYIDKAETDWRLNSKYAINHWCKVVGDQQRLLPISIINYYCEPDKPFDPCPNFEEDFTSRTDMVKLGSIGYWYTVKSGDGASVGFYRGSLKEGAAGGKLVAVKNGEGPPCKDIIALQALWKVRTRQFESLKIELQEAATHRMT